MVKYLLYCRKAWWIKLKISERFNIEKLRPEVYDKKLKYIAKATLYSFFTTDIDKRSAQLAYYLLFSLFPFLIFINSLFSYFNIDLTEIEKFVNSAMPHEAAGLIVGYFNSITAVKSPLLTAFALFMVVSSSARALAVILNFLSDSFDMPTKMPLWINSIILSFFLIVYISVSVTLTTASSVILGDVLKIFNISQKFLNTWNILRWILLGGLSFIVVSAVYYVVPRGRIKYRQTIVPALFCLVGWLAVSLLFSYYVNNFARYSLIYGSLGAVIALMLWLYFTSTVMLWGGQLNYILYTYKKQERIK